MRGLAGRVALVTGGNTGIGAAVVTRLAAEGVSVAIGTYEDADGSLALAERVSSDRQRCIAVRCDVTDDDAVRSAVDEVTTNLGSPSILVNNAGVLTRARLEDLTATAWDAAIDVSLSGSFRCSRAFVAAARERGGTIVNVASELVWLGGRNLAHYVAAKAGVVGLTRALASELGPDGIRVNAVAPGPTDTRMLEDTARDPAFVATIPLRRLGRPEDVAGVVAFLCSDDADWITGQVLGVNGGLVMAG